MKTKIANALFIFLLIICVIMLSFLAYRKINPPGTVIKDKSVRETPSVSVSQKKTSAVVELQTAFILPEMQDTSVSGTGTIIDPSGLILTNFQAVKDTRTANAKLSTGASYMANVIAVDPENDIALLKIKDPQFGLPVIPLLRPQKSVPEIQDISVDFLCNPKRFTGKLFLQRCIDMMADPETNGGPLLDSDGKMIGFNMSGKKNFSGFHFTLPLLYLENILAKYLLPERMLSMSFGLLPAVNAEGRIFVRHVFRGSPAYRAGIRRGMEIFSFQGWDPKHDLLELCRRMIRLKPGEPAEIALKTAGTVSVAPISFAQCPAQIPVYWKLGILAVDVNPDHILAQSSPFRNGVLVVGGERSGQTLFRRGDVIVGWNRKKIRNMEDLKSAVQNAPMGSRAFVTVFTMINDARRGPLLVRQIYPVFVR